MIKLPATGPLATCILMSLFAIQCAADAPPPPNIVVIIGDDISPDFGVYGGPAHTPNIDSVAEGGLVFSNAYATASSCSPSRISMLTGRYPHNHGAPELHMPMPSGQFAFTEALQAEGYYVAAAGKWHMGDAAESSFDSVLDRGYPADPTGAADWLDTLRERPADKPFLMWLSAYDAHRPWEPLDGPPDHDAKTISLPAGIPDTPLAREDFARYLDEVSRFDANVGDVFRELETQGILESTIVIIVGDNGRPFPRNKTSLYDNGMKVPFVVHWPNGIASPGRDSNALVSLIDIAPTVLDVVRIEIPESIQGQSLIPVFRKTKDEVRQALFGERNWHVQRGLGRMVRGGDFVYIRNFTPTSYSFQMVNHQDPSYAELLRLREQDALTEEQAEVFSTDQPEEALYNVRTDPQQLNNLATLPEYQEQLKRLRDKLNVWQEKTGDSIPALEAMTPDRHDRETFEKRYPGSRPPTGEIPGQRDQAETIGKTGIALIQEPGDEH